MGLLDTNEIVSALNEQCQNSPLIKNYYTLSFLHCTELHQLLLCIV